MSPIPPAYQTGMTQAPQTQWAAGCRPPTAAQAHLPQALHAEWTKLRTIVGTYWLLATAITLTVTVGAAVAAATRCPAGPACPVDTAKLSLTGVQLGQAVIAVLATATVCGEYSTGIIRVTLTATPRRSAVLAAKATVLTILVLPAGTITVAGSVLAGRLILPGHGFTAARGYPSLWPANGPLLRAAVGSVLYLALIALLSLGVATIIRDSAAAIGAVLGLLYLPPVIAAVLASYPKWQQEIDRWAPTNAGLTIQDTTNLHSLPISPWAGLGVLATWAAAALLAGGLMFQLRDA
jgi:ABC-2 type transport system permease protein